MSIYQNLGFSTNPFAYTNADEEENLEKYFVPPPYYDAIKGDYHSPSSNIVIAPRGSGKTAQRKMIESWCRDKPILCVTYDRFELGERGLETVSLNYHLKNIISRSLLNLIIWLSDYPDSLSNFTKDDKRNLNILCHTYLGDVTGWKVNEVLKDIQSVPEKIKNYWNNNIGILDSLLNFLLKKYELPKLDLPKLSEDEKTLGQSYKYQLELIYELATKLHFKAVYVLIDKVDETNVTTNNAEATFKLIEPLLKDLETHGIKGYAFKYFLWDRVYPNVLAGARADRIPIHTLIWSREKLNEMLKKRLMAFSNDSISSMNQLLTNPSSFSVDDVVTILAWRSPRNVIRICQEMIAEQTLISAGVSKLRPTVLDSSSLKISEKISEELYGTEVVSEIKKLDRGLFTINHLGTNIYKTSNNAVRPRVASWVDKGFLFHVGGDKSTSTKPINVYLVGDPRVNRIIYSRENVVDWLVENWFTCSHCDADIILPLAYLSNSVELECWHCKRPVSIHGLVRRRINNIELYLDLPTIQPVVRPVQPSFALSNDGYLLSVEEIDVRGRRLFVVQTDTNSYPLILAVSEDSNGKRQWVSTPKSLHDIEVIGGQIAAYIRQHKG